MRPTWRHGQRGSAATELVLITPVLIVMLLFVVALGRIASSRAEVDAASRDAARAASNARSIATAVTNSDTAAQGDLHAADVTCVSLSIVLDTANFHAGGTVTATVSCTVALRDLVGLAIPASRTITAHFTEPIDVYRGIS